MDYLLKLDAREKARIPTAMVKSFSGKEQNRASVGFKTDKHNRRI